MKLRKKYSNSRWHRFYWISFGQGLFIQKFNVFSFSSSKPKTIRTLSKVKYFIGKLENKNDLKKFDKTVFDYVVNCGGYVDHKNKKKHIKVIM